MTVRPGDQVSVGDTEIVVLESFDRTVLVTAPKGVVLKGQPVQEMDEASVNYLVSNAGRVALPQRRLALLKLVRQTRSRLSS